MPEQSEQSHPPQDQELNDLRAEHYNATIVERLDIHKDLARFRIRPDGGVPRFEPGQYVALGLGFWESRLAGVQDEALPATKYRKLVRRAYSISCPLLDPNKRLLPCRDCDYLEFYITLIRMADQPPAFTPRLFNLSIGERIFVQPRIAGAYTLAGVNSVDDVVMLATGTGEAPHNAMAAELLSRNHRGKIVVATCARWLADFGYREEHDVLSATYDNYKYLTYTTRESRNLDPKAAGFVGIERLQTVYASGRLADEAGLAFQPDSTHVFLCGNPAMIGLRRPTDPPLEQPGMLQLLVDDGFQSMYPTATATKQVPPAPGAGIVRYEKYW